MHAWATVEKKMLSPITQVVIEFSENETFWDNKNLFTWLTPDFDSFSSIEHAIRDFIISNLRSAYNEHSYV